MRNNSGKKHGRAEDMQGRIGKGIAGFYYVHVVGSGVYECKAKGIFRREKKKPLVGDEVIIEVLDEERKEGNIVQILPRRNELVRPAVSNIDQALVMFAAARPSPHFNLLDRLLVMMQRREIPAVLCFNKSELISQEELAGIGKTYAQCGCPLVFISVYEQTGIARLRELLEGKTTALAGPSGVGKSSLINLFAPEADMKTGDISRKIERGKHTTRHSELFWLGGHTYLMDTPGFTSLYENDFEKEELKYYFPEFGPYEGSCRFAGCVHIEEPGCAVKAAVEKGEIHAVRYRDYREMYEELKNKRRY